MKFKRWKILIWMMRQNLKSECFAWFKISVSFIVILSRFWNMKSENCPEMRCEIARKSRQANRENKINPVEKKSEKFTPKLFADCGRPYCLNGPKLEFAFRDEVDRYELDLHVYKLDRLIK